MNRDFHRTGGRYSYHHEEPRRRIMIIVILPDAICCYWSFVPKISKHKMTCRSPQATMSEKAEDEEFRLRHLQYFMVKDLGKLRYHQS